MSIDAIIEFMQKLKAEKGNIVVSCDFRYTDTELRYSEDLHCVFGE